MNDYINWSKAQYICERCPWYDRVSPHTDHNNDTCKRYSGKLPCTLDKAILLCDLHPIYKKQESVIIPTNSIKDIDHAEKCIKEVWGNIPLYRHYFTGDKLTAWYIGKPDRYYQNHIAQMGAANLVIDCQN